VEKGALKITIDLGSGRKLNIWNVHLQAGTAPTTRTQQINQLAKWVQDAEDDQIADVIAGDFNCTPNSPQYRHLVEALGQEVRPIGSQGHFATYHGRSSNSEGACTLDYVFVRPRRPSLTLRGSLQPMFSAGSSEDCLSDHLGLGVEMNLDVVPLLSKLPGGRKGGSSP
jgi:endonuclease/exonuclease/phosphatase family metal-dependent hydrolase